MAEAGDALLFQLKSLGSARADGLAARLGISGQAVRQGLARLLSQGLVRYEDQPAGRGRPKRLWRLAPAAAARFPDTHAQLTVDLLRDVAAALGPDALDRVLDLRARALVATYRARLSSCRQPRRRLERLARIRSEEGYMASVASAADGSFILTEDHCPICAAAMACQKLCTVELAVFREVLGAGWEIERLDHLLAGARRCAYRLRPPPAPCQARPA